MEIKHENIKIVLDKNKITSQQKQREEQELIKKLCENIRSVLENEFGKFDMVNIREDLEPIFFNYRELSVFGYRNSTVDLARILEAITKNNKQIIITVCVRDISHVQESKFKTFFDKIKKLFFHE